MLQGLPAFRERAPWWGADLQTLRNSLRRPRHDLRRVAAERLWLELADGSGDRLAALLQRPERIRGPLVVLVHGLGGSQDSVYMQASAAYHLGRGHPVLRLNLRGAGASRPHCRLQYHAGRSEDLRDALAVLPAELLASGVLLVGYSLGGNMLLKFLAEHATALPVRAAASVSAPIDLAAASRRFLERRNRFYHWLMLSSMKREALAPGAAISAAERRAIESAGSILEFDERFVAPRNGFVDAEDYYARNAARGFLASVPLPTLLIHALDDPWIPGASYLRHPWGQNPNLTPLLASGGGHVGFHARASRVAWHDRAIGLFFEHLCARD